VWQGDGEVALAPKGIDESEIVSDFYRAARRALRRINRGAVGMTDPQRLRLRVAMHTGAAAANGAGLVGAGVVRTCRLVNALASRAALENNPRSDLALTISQALFEDVICAEEHDLMPADFRPVRVVIDEKRFTADAWLHVADLTRSATDMSVVLAGPLARHAGSAQVSDFGIAGAGSSGNAASQNHRVAVSTDSMEPAC
jgi:hypothetical protein